jgi:hypothetical protein
MAEWLKALVLKTRDPETGPGVRIPLLPPIFPGERKNCPEPVEGSLSKGACRREPVEGPVEEGFEQY